MAEIQNSRNKIYANSLKLILQNVISLLIGQGFILFLFVFTLTPLLSNIYHMLLSVTGLSYVTLVNIVRFLLNPISLIMAVLLFLIIGLFMLFEICYLITHFSFIENDKKVRFYWVLFISLFKMILFIKKRDIKIIPIAWMTLGIFNLPLVIFAFYRIRLLRYYMDEISDKMFVLFLGLVIIGILCAILLRKLFIFHYYLIEDKSYTVSAKHSKDMEKSRPVQSFFYFLVWNVIIFLIVILLYIFTMIITTLLVSGAFDNSLAIATFISINDSMNTYLMTFIFFICTIGNFALYTRLFYHYQLASDHKDILEETLNSKKEGSEKSYKKILKIVIVCLVAINFYFFLNILRNGSPLDYMNLDIVQVTSHRGFSHDVPENTLPAIEKAIEEQADYVEVDVRVTKDGELVLLHDSSLKRTTGINKNVNEMNYEQIALLDAGSWVNTSFRDIRIPTLREVFELCKGKVYLNLDLKYSNAKEELVEKVVALIEEYEMEWQCVISSTSLLCLKGVKELNPDVRTGFITYQLYAGVSTRDDIDFFSMKSNLVTKGVVREIHKNGKELHVWTANSKTEIERLKRLGVDNIITDDSAFAKEILYQSDSDQYFLTLLKIMME